MKDEEFNEKLFAEGLLIGLKRHTWMKDGITYVGNGTYTLKEAIKMLKNDYPNLQNAFKLLT